MAGKRDVKTIAPLWLADAEAGVGDPAVVSDPDAHAGELLAGAKFRAWFSRGLDVWTPRLERFGKWIAALALVLGGLVKLVHDFRSTTVTPAELPKGSGERMFSDRVDRPSPPVDRPAAHPGSDRDAPP